MNDLHGLGEAALQSASSMLGRVGAHLPGFFAAVVLVVLGWALARVMRALTARAMLLVDMLLQRMGLPAGVSHMRAARASVVAGTVVFWVVLFFFVTAAAQVLGLQAFSDWLGKLVDYLPTFAAGLLILAAGWLISGFAADLVQATVSRLDAGQRNMLARIVRVAILAGAILVGADQIGIRITFLAIFVGAIAATVGGGVALAVGFGAREHVANLIAAHQFRQAYAPGQTLRIAEHEGRLLEITATSVILEAGEGRVVLPARMLNEQPVTVTARDPHG